MKIVEFLRTRCPKCNSQNHRSIHKRKSGIVVVRYHECMNCGEAFRSEQVETGRKARKA